MSKGGPHDLGEVSHRNVVPCSSDGIRSNHASVASAQKEREAVLTDMVCPPPSSTAGALLATNLEKIKESGVTVHGPREAVSAFDVPDDLLADTCVFLIGSPAGHDPFNERLDQNPASDNVRFKEAIFYSLCHATPPESAVAMTYSNGACGKLEYWTLPDTYPPRTLVVAPAWFAHYRPRRGLADTLDALADVPDTMLAMYLPAPFAASLRWKEGKVDGSATISGWLSGRGRLVSFACYMGELEADIFCDGGKQCSCFSQGEQAAGSARRAKNSHGLERRGAGMESEEELGRGGEEANAAGEGSRRLSDGVHEP